jgi:large subunit ribosomal protein L22
MADTVSKAKLRYIRVAPRKARLVADLIRGRDVDEALRMLTFTRKKSAPMISKLISSAVANATEIDPTVDVDDLFVKTIYVDGGPTLRRYLPRAQGRATRILKKTSHITVELGSR